MPDIICPHCQNPTWDEDALLCHFCGESLGRCSSGALGKMRGAGMKWVWVTIGIVMVLAMIGMMIY